MSKSKGQYKPDYGRLYPDTPISGEVAAVLTKNNRKMEYQEYDLKRDGWKVDLDVDTSVYVPSREDSLDRLLEAERQFPHEDESVENAAERSLMLEKLRSCLGLLTAKERKLIDALFFENGGEGVSETAYAARTGVTRQAVHGRLVRVLRKMKIFLEMGGCI